jgi:aspartate-semialdehyde dehydrogenase
LDKIPVGVLGATGTVGQRFTQLLADHPWFEVVALAASDRSTGRRYAEACHWLLPTAMPEAVRDMVVQPVEPTLECRLVFSALPADIAGPSEESFARAGYAVCSNASAHRMDTDVPLVIPEVNADHTGLIDTQRRQHGWEGFIVTSANCSTTALTLALKPLHTGFGLRKLFVVTMQAVSGAGYPGVPSMDIVDNVIPYIGGEEGKMETEPLKLLGTVEQDHVCMAPIAVSAQCNRVAVRDGHTECVSIETEHRVSVDDVIAALETFRPLPEVAELPSTPSRPIVVRREVDRPQPIRDRDAGEGMSVSVGRVRLCALFDCKFVVLGHNTVRGAAGGSIHNAELLVSQQWIA